MNGIEEGPGVELDRGSQIATGESLYEVGDVAPDDVRVEAELVRPDDTFFTERLPHDVQ